MRNQVLLHLIQHLRGHSQADRGDGPEKGLYDDSIDRARGHTLADLFVTVLIASPANIRGRPVLSGRPVLNAHLPTTDAAVNNPLQESASFPRHAAVPVVAPILPQPLLVLHEFLPPDIGRMVRGNFHRPLFHGTKVGRGFACLWRAPLIRVLRPAVDVGTRVGRVVEDANHRAQRGRFPHQ